MGFVWGLGIGLFFGFLCGAGALWFFFSLAEEGSLKVKAASRSPKATPTVMPAKESELCE